MANTVKKNKNRKKRGEREKEGGGGRGKERRRGGEGREEREEEKVGEGKVGEGRGRGPGTPLPVLVVPRTPSPLLPCEGAPPQRRVAPTLRAQERSSRHVPGTHNSLRDTEKVISLKIRKTGTSLVGQWLTLCSQRRDPRFVRVVRSNMLELSLCPATTEPSGSRATRATCQNKDPVQPKEKNQKEKVSF